MVSCLLLHQLLLRLIWFASGSGTTFAIASQLDPSSSTETIGPSAATVKENNKPAGPIESHPVHESDQSPTPSPAKESRPTETAGPSVATSQANNKRNVTIRCSTLVTLPSMSVALEDSHIAEPSVLLEEKAFAAKDSKKAKWTLTASFFKGKRSKSTYMGHSTSWSLTLWILICSRSARGEQLGGRSSGDTHRRIRQSMQASLRFDGERREVIAGKLEGRLVWKRCGIILANACKEGRSKVWWKKGGKSLQANLKVALLENVVDSY